VHGIYAQVAGFAVRLRFATLANAHLNRRGLGEFAVATLVNLVFPQVVDVRYRDPGKPDKTLIAIYVVHSQAEDFNHCTGCIIHDPIHICQQANICLRILRLKAFDRALPSPDMARFAILFDQLAYVLASIARQSLDIAQDKAF